MEEGGMGSYCLMSTIWYDGKVLELESGDCCTTL